MSKLSTVISESELIGLIYVYFAERSREPGQNHWFWNCAKFIKSLPVDVRAQLTSTLIEEVDKASQHYLDPVEDQLKVVAEVEVLLFEHIARIASLEYQLAAKAGIKFIYILGAFQPIAFKSAATQTEILETSLESTATQTEVPEASLENIICQGHWPQCALHLAYLRAKHSKQL